MVGSVQIIFMHPRHASVESSSKK